MAANPPLRGALTEFWFCLLPEGCQLVLEPQCHMLPYNQTWLASSVAVVKSTEVDMLLR